MRRLPRLARHTGPAGPVERASADDLMQLAADVGPAPGQVGLVLVVDAAGPGSQDAVAAALAERAARIPRLRQVLMRPPPGCGRPVWVDDPTFDVGRHVRRTPCPPPGDEPALADVAAVALTERLTLRRPPWAATLVTGLAGGGTAVVLVVHHVLADGVGGLSALRLLLDGAGPLPPLPGARPAPSRRMLAADAWGARRAALRRLPAGGRRLVDALGELDPRSALTRVPSRTSLNRPVGPARHLAVLDVSLHAVRRAGSAYHATVNDVLLSAVVGALARLLAERGERPDCCVVSVPVSPHVPGAAPRLGNRVGVMPVALPVGADRAQRLAEVATITRAAKSAARGSSATVLVPAFRALAAVGLLRPLVDRQRLVHTFVTNVPGPRDATTLAGRPVRRLVMLPNLSGNVTVSVGALSYGDVLALTVVTDPAACPDRDLLVALLAEELAALAGA